MLSTFGPSHAGRVTRRLCSKGSQRRELHTVSLLSELYDHLNGSRMEGKGGQVKLCHTVVLEKKLNRLTDKRQPKDFFKVVLTFKN